MTNPIQKLWRSFRGSVRGIDSNRQLALGTMFGMIIGMIPKDSLFCYAFLVLLMLTTANLICAIFSGFVFTLFSAILAPVAHRIGGWILTFDPIETLWAQIYQWPLMGWTRFENTVVTGSLVVALLIAVPVYYFSFRFFEQFAHVLYKRLGGSRLGSLSPTDDEHQPSDLSTTPDFAGSEI